MKYLTLIIHPNVQQDMADQLRNLGQVSGFTFKSRGRARGRGRERSFPLGAGTRQTAPCPWRTTFNIRFYENFKLLND
jgi:nitrogen regulatory protein PII